MPYREPLNPADVESTANGIRNIEARFRAHYSLGLFLGLADASAWSEDVAVIARLRAIAAAVRSVDMVTD